MLYRSNDEAMIEMLQKRPGVAAELLKIAIEEDTPEELKNIMSLISAAGYDVSVTAKAKPTSRSRTKANKAKPNATKKTTRHPATRSRTRRTTAVTA